MASLPSNNIRSLTENGSFRKKIDQFSVVDPGLSTEILGEWGTCVENRLEFSGKFLYTEAISPYRIN
jgi:hypothetical protein